MKPFTISGWEKHAGEIEAEENPLAVQACPLVSIFLDKTPKSQKKVFSLIQKSLPVSLVIHLHVTAIKVVLPCTHLAMILKLSMSTRPRHPKGCILQNSPIYFGKND